MTLKNIFEKQIHSLAVPEQKYGKMILTGKAMNVADTQCDVELTVPDDYRSPRSGLELRPTVKKTPD